MNWKNATDIADNEFDLDVRFTPAAAPNQQRMAGITSTCADECTLAPATQCLTGCPTCAGTCSCVTCANTCGGTGRPCHC